ncbi:MAG: glycine cleavage system protein GcvH [Planctomycetota bacterium]
MRPDDRKYLKSHEWVKVDGDIAWIGISDYAVGHLSDLVFLDLPEIGTDVMANEPFGEIESVKAVSDLYCPLTGEIIEQNEELLGDLSLLQQDPWEKGWMVKLRIMDKKELELPTLLDAAAYEKVVQSESH